MSGLEVGCAARLRWAERGWDSTLLGTAGSNHGHHLQGAVAPGHLPLVPPHGIITATWRLTQLPAAPQHELHDTRSHCSYAADPRHQPDQLAAACPSEPASQPAFDPAPSLPLTLQAAPWRTCCPRCQSRTWTCPRTCCPQAARAPCWAQPCTRCPARWPAAPPASSRYSARLRA
jgi:hypothetical protein